MVCISSGWKIRVNLKKSEEGSHIADRWRSSKLPRKRQGIMVLSDRNEDLGKMEVPDVLWWGRTPR